MKKYKIFFLLFPFILSSQINPKEIDIIRDKFGVPHIYAKTDAEVAYGLAWAHAEDDFLTIQKGFLAGNALLSKYIGKKGIPADFVTQLIQAKKIINENYDNKISENFKKILKAYAEGLNNYAKKYPNKVLLKELFPITPKKMSYYSQLQLFISSRGDYWLIKILKNKLGPSFNSSLINQNSRGSNTFAFNKNKTIDGDTYFAINTHQPLDGPVSWYEAHLCSEEGTNIIGALFAGSPVVLTGTNENLSWAHTVNLPDKTDVYKLEMHPTIKNKYKVDSDYLDLERHKADLYIKILGIPIKIKKKYYKSIYGPTIRNNNGYYSIRTPALSEIRALEQWWKMNKANSFTEFYNILKMKALPGYNIGYADINDTIFYISNGLIPIRKKGYNWKSVVPGNTKKTLWDKTYQIEDLPQVLQPNSGYIYNANHSPFKSTGNSENPKADDFDSEMGFELYDNNRSKRIKYLIDSKEKMSYQDFKKLKYDNQLPEKLNYSWMDINSLFDIKAELYPDIQILIKRIQNWDKKA
ncbi:MAG: penicillin acylase family protein [Flavobacteriaceae bacterium]|nr:penicillin acylase family protein [Flavobacteriaceae bacterium]